MKKEIRIPAISENVETGTISGILVSKGDSIEKDQPVVEVETDKATTDIPSPYAGTVDEIKVEEGDEVEVDQVIMVIETEDESEDGGQKTEEEEEKKESEDRKEEAEEEKEESEEEEEKEETEDEEEEEEEKKSEDQKRETEDEEEEEEESEDRSQSAGKAGPTGEAKKSEEKDKKPIPASPSVRRLAREIGVNIAKVEGTGPGNRITTDDVKSYAKAASKGKKTSATATMELPDFSQWGETERKSMNRIRQITAQSMLSSWQNIPQVTQFDEADVTELEEFRQKQSKKVEKAGGKLTVTSMLVKICGLALEKFPRFNASIDYDKKELILKKYYNVGLAVDTPQGLLVPVVRDVDKKTMTDISVEVTEMAKKAREKKLSLDAMQGGNFTISNLGGIGGTNFTPIVYSPQVAILGLSRATQRVVSTDEGFEERIVLPLSLTYDHRVIDGADGARFLRWIADALENPMSIFM